MEYARAMARPLTALREAGIVAAEPFRWSGRRSLIVFVALYAIPFFVQLGFGMEALRSVGISLTVPLAVFAALVLWEIAVARPRRENRHLVSALAASREVVSSGVVALNGQLEKARHLRDRIEQTRSGPSFAFFDPEIDAWIGRTAALLGDVSPEDVAGFRADTGQYDVAFDWTVEGITDQHLESKNRRLRRMDRHVERLAGIITQLRWHSP